MLVLRHYEDRTEADIAGLLGFLLDGIDGVTYPVVWPSSIEVADGGGQPPPNVGQLSGA